MAKIKILTAEDVELYEFYVDDSYLTQTVVYAVEAIRNCVLDSERKQLLSEVDDTLQTRVAEKIALIKEPEGSDLFNTTG